MLAADVGNRLEHISFEDLQELITLAKQLFDDLETMIERSND